MQKGAIFLNRLTEITKRDIYELFRDGCTVEDLFHTENVQYPYYGRLEEIDFLERLYDSRHENAKGDIIRHTINNDDYPYCWVFEDDRFGLANGSDEMFLRFICEIFHPLVRDEKKTVGIIFRKSKQFDKRRRV